MDVDVLRGPWNMERDADGHRTYVRRFRTRAEPGVPEEAHLAAPGLPKVGEPFRTEDGTVNDPAAVCTGTLRPLDVGTHAYTAFDLAFVFSTRPPAAGPPEADAPVFVG